MERMPFRLGQWMCQWCSLLWAVGPTILSNLRSLSSLTLTFSGVSKKRRRKKTRFKMSSRLTSRHWSTSKTKKRSWRLSWLTCRPSWSLVEMPSLKRKRNRQRSTENSRRNLKHKSSERNNCSKKNYSKRKKSFLYSKLTKTFRLK